jgi:arsenite oxidase small subunit
MRLSRRRLIQILTGIPIIGGGLAILSPLLRYVKPNEHPYGIPLTQSDTPEGGAQIVGTTTALKKPWDYFYFTYVQKFVQYDQARYEAENIPGVAIRLPRKVRFANTQGYDGYNGETDIVLFSRICPHLGCIFNFIPAWHNVTTGYGGFVPPNWERHPLMACPCHFSIYDPAYPGDPGNVISGPAPRGARYFRFQVQGENIVVTGAETGAIAYEAPAAPSDQNPDRRIAS